MPGKNILGNCYQCCSDCGKLSRKKNIFATFSGVIICPKTTENNPYGVACIDCTINATFMLTQSSPGLWKTIIPNGIKYTQTFGGSYGYPAGTGTCGSLPGASTTLTDLIISVACGGEVFAGPNDGSTFWLFEGVLLDIYNPVLNTQIDNPPSGPFFSCFFNAAVGGSMSLSW